MVLGVLEPQYSLFLCVRIGVRHVLGFVKMC